MNVTPEVIRFPLSSDSSIVGLPCNVHVTFERFVMSMLPSRDPAAPSIEAIACS